MRAILLAMSRTSFPVGYALSLVFVLVLRVAAAPTEGQIAGTQPSEHLDAVDLERKAESALDRVQRNDIGVGIVDATGYIELAAHVDAVRTIPVLEAFFSRTQEQDIRNETASVLVSLGDQNPQFWNLILHQAQTAII